MLLPLQTPHVEALVYSTMASLAAHRPEMALDGDPKTSFRSHGGMEEMDELRIVFLTPVRARTVRLMAGAGDGDEPLTGARLEYSEDGDTFRGVALKSGDYQLLRDGGPIRALRLRMAKGKALSRLVVREIAVDGATVHARRGPGRPFIDLNGNADLKGWADKAKAQMEEFWEPTEAMLYSEGFVPPNAVNVVFETGPGVTGVAAYGGGKMQVNTAWCKAHPEDTPLTVHEMAHVIQSGTSPGWLTEAVADYVRWVKYEPQNHTPRFDPKETNPRQPYRTGATFLGWCELHYDRKLVTKLNDDARFGRYRDSLFERYCGKPIDALWKEFVADYQKDPKALLQAPVPPAMRPRTLPTATASAPVDVPYVLIGTYPDGARFRDNGGFDEGGAAFAAPALGRSVKANGVEFRLGPAGAANVLPARGQTLRLSGTHRTLWILAAAVEGGQRDQTLTVAYADGTTARWDQNFSDWYAPEGFPGELRAVKMPYRVLANGTRDERPFNVYAYGFVLDPTKELRGLTLPDNPNVRVLAVSVGD